MFRQVLLRHALLAGVLILLAGCPGSGGPDAADRDPSPGASVESPEGNPTRKPKGGKRPNGKPEAPDVDLPPGFEVVRSRVLGRCVAPPLKGTCPIIVPKTKGNYLVESFGRPGGRFGVLEMSSGAPRDDPAANAPPAFAHVVLEAGKPGFLIDFGSVSATAKLSDDLVLQPRPGSVLLGSRTWGKRKGQLLLAEPFPGGGAHGGHLVFQWRRGGIVHRISLHAWVPAKRAKAALETMVRSMSSPPVTR
jgi:hypothetical protein